MQDIQYSVTYSKELDKLVFTTFLLSKTIKCCSHFGHSNEIMLLEKIAFRFAFRYHSFGMKSLFLFSLHKTKRKLFRFK